MRLALAFCLLASPIGAQTCPATPDHTVRLEEIIRALQIARGASEARLLTNELWTLWTDAPDARAQALLDEGMGRRATFDLRGARSVLDRLVDYCPDYAEGYNQRAFASYLAQDFSAALIDLDRALELMPNHVAALSGKGLTLMGLGRHDEAQEVLRAAVDLNPWLQERELLQEDPGIEL